MAWSGADVPIQGLQLLTDQEACGQIYAIGDPGLAPAPSSGQHGQPRADRVVTTA
jgi:hypothetical protein